MKEVRIGILGAGFMATTHSKNLLRIPGVRITGICDKDIKKAEDLASSLKPTCIKVFGDFGDMLNKCQMDALYICLPPFAHDGQVEEAAKKGIHVFIEKPIALDTIHATSMVKAIRELGVVSQVGYHMRFGAAVRKLKGMIEDGVAGIPTLLDASYQCNSLHAPWWRDKNKSGGQVFEQVIHSYDLAMFFLGQPETVVGFTSNICHRDVQGYTVEDTSSASIKFTSGALASICASNCAVPMEWNNRFTVICKNVTAHFENPNKAIFIFTDREETTQLVIDDNVDMYFEENQAFIAAVRGEGSNICTIEEGFKSLQMVEALVKSAEAGGRPVNINSK